MDEADRQQQLDVDAGYTAQEVLQRAAARTRADRDRALVELATSATDQEIFDLVGLDMEELRRGPDLSGGWSLP